MSEMNVRGALEFREQGLAQLDLLVTGETHAKTGLLIAAVLRKNIVLGGAAGGGKSTLAQDSWRLIEDASPDNVVHMLGQHDVTATQMVGGQIVTNQEEVTGGRKTRKSTTTVVDAQVKPDTLWLDIDEINLMNPHAAQAFLPVLENRILRTTAGVQEMKHLRTVTATLNPTDNTREVGFQMSERQASRFALGAMVGEDASWPQEKREERVGKIREFRKNPATGDPEKMQPVISLEGLDVLRTAALRTPMEAKLETAVDRLAIKTVKALADERITEDSGRLSTQIEDIAKAYALLTTKEQVVGEEAIAAAVTYIITARMAILRKKTHAQVNGIVKGVLSH